MSAEELAASQRAREVRLNELSQRLGEPNLERFTATKILLFEDELMSRVTQVAFGDSPRLPLYSYRTEAGDETTYEFDTEYHGKYALPARYYLESGVHIVEDVLKIDKSSQTNPELRENAVVTRYKSTKIPSVEIEEAVVVEQNGLDQRVNWSVVNTGSIEQTEQDHSGVLNFVNFVAGRTEPEAPASFEEEKRKRHGDVKVYAFPQARSTREEAEPNEPTRIDFVKLKRQMQRAYLRVAVNNEPGVFIVGAAKDADAIDTFTSTSRDAEFDLETDYTPVIAKFLESKGLIRESVVREDSSRLQVVDVFQTDQEWLEFARVGYLDDLGQKFIGYDWHARRKGSGYKLL